VTRGSRELDALADPAAEPLPAVASGGPRRRRTDGIVAAGIYLGVSLLLVGLHVLPALAHRVIGHSPDAFAHAWFLSWWPHAAAAGTDPLFTHDVWSPAGVSLALTTSDAAPAMLLAPITLLAGPLATLNVIAVLAPALSAWTAYLLFRDITRSHVPSLIGGMVYGYSPFVAAHVLSGQPDLELVFLIPVVVLIVLRSLREELPPRKALVLLAVTLTLQFLISEEVYATVAAFGAMALGGAAVIFRVWRTRIAHSASLAVGAYVISAIVVSPFIVAALRSPPPVAPGVVPATSADLAGFVEPPSFLLAHRSSFIATWHGPVLDAYLGPAIVLLVGAFAWRFRRNRAAWGLIALFLLTCLLSLGPRVRVNGHPRLWLPYELVRHVPLMRFAVPSRFLVYAWLLAGAMVAMLLAPGTSVRTRRRSERARWGMTARVAVTGVLLVSIAPIPSAFAAADVRTPVFFASGVYQRFLRPNETVLLVPGPWSGKAMLWQAATGFRFRMPDGYVSPSVPPGERGSPVIVTLLQGSFARGFQRSLIPFVRRHVVEHIVVVGPAGPWIHRLAPIDPSPIEVGGATVFTVPTRLLPTEGS
jgi:Predicted membrane protein (DUF2079)